MKALGPSKVATRLAQELAELQFGNTVGFVWAGPALGRLEVVAGKWEAGSWRILTTRLLEEVYALPFAGPGGGATPTVGDAPMDQVQLYQAFLYLRHVIGSPETGAKADLTGAFRSLLARPHRTPSRRQRIVPTALARQIDTSGLVAIASGQMPLVRSRQASRMRGHLPTEVHESVLHHTTDNAENRFARALLREVLSVTFRVRKEARGISGGFGRRLVEEIDFLEAQLEPIERHSLWKEVGHATGVPGSSTVLQRRSDYRTLFQHHIRLRLGLRLPSSPAELRRMIELKDVAAMYELWCAFAVLRAVRHELGPPTSVSQARRSTFDTTIRWGLMARWSAHDVTLSFNPSFTRGAKSRERRSSSLPLRPDVLLETPTARHALDAKFKLGKADKSGPKPEDVQKMHTYRDALPIDSAWVLYPGQSVVHYPSLKEYRDAISGVGAIPVHIEGTNPDLGELVRRMLHGPATRSHQELGPFLPGSAA